MRKLLKLLLVFCLKQGRVVTRILSVPLTVCVLLLASLPASAIEVSSIPGGTVVPMPMVNAFGPGPQTFGGGDITWSSTNASNQGGSVFGFTQGYGFTANGSWTGLLGPMAGLNDSFTNFGVTDTMTFALASPVNAIGGFVNYLPGSENPTTLAVYDSGHNLIESTHLNFTTGGGLDSGLFVGFQEDTANISFFTLTDNYVGITNLTVSAVPEPEIYAMMGIGLLLMGFVAHRRKGQAAAVFA